RLVLFFDEDDAAEEVRAECVNADAGIPPDEGSQVVQKFPSLFGRPRVRTLVERNLEVEVVAENLANRVFRPVNLGDCHVLILLCRSSLTLTEPSDCSSVTFLRR